MTTTPELTTVEQFDAETTRIVTKHAELFKQWGKAYIDEITPVLEQLGKSDIPNVYKQALGKKIVDMLDNLDLEFS